MIYTTDKIRKMFLDFFIQNKHKIIQGSSLIPKENSNLLFTNAGMNQFQNIFLGKKKYEFSKVVTIQKCLRTGGKHNDLEQIGYSEYHHTFFEMLGNFSFGEYFKKEAILYAWKLLTDKKWFNIKEDQLAVSVYEQDNESYDIWKNIIGLSKKNIIRIGNNNKPYESDNFWNMGNIGPCGPCTEIFFKKSNYPLSLDNLQDKNKYLEIWNIVFIQFNRINDTKLIPLPFFSVDTGMGLERIASVLQKVNSNYEIDSFKKLKISISKINNIKKIHHQNSINVIADHIRASVFIIENNILPENEHRGYILRRIIRRALRHGYKLKIKNPFFYKLVLSVIESMGESAKYLKIKQKKIENILKQEELQFIQTLHKGLKLLKLKIKTVKNQILDGNTVFYLYDTIGFPIDLTHDICHENNIQINYEELNKKIKYQKQKSKKNYHNIKNIANIIQSNFISTFKGYTHNKIISMIKNIFIEGQEKKKILPNQKGIIILDRTPFYGESGGQTGDSGIIYNKTSLFHVYDTQNYTKSIHHIGQISTGILKINDIVTAYINKKKRKIIQNNHSATHLLQNALNKVLNTHIQQKGSSINEKYLRFDFSYNKKIDLKKIFYLEDIVNKNIQKNITISDQYMNFKKAKLKNYKFLQNKKYNSIIRTLTIGKISTEICRGTHSKRTGDIGLFKILYSKSISHDIYRIEAITGIKAFQDIQLKNKNIIIINQLLKSNTMSVIPKITKLITYCNDLENTNKKLNQNMISNYKYKLIKKIIYINKIKFLQNEIKIKDRKLIKIMIDQLKIIMHSGIIILFYIQEKNHIFIIGVTKDLTKIIQANQIVKKIKKYTNGSGGGKPEIAECVIKNIKNFYEMLNKIKNWIISQIS